MYFFLVGVAIGLFIVQAISSWMEKEKSTISVINNKCIVRFDNEIYGRKLLFLHAFKIKRICEVSCSYVQNGQVSKWPIISIHKNGSTYVSGIPRTCEEMSIDRFRIAVAVNEKIYRYSYKGSEAISIDEDPVGEKDIQKSIAMACD